MGSVLTEQKCGLNEKLRVQTVLFPGLSPRNYISVQQQIRLLRKRIADQRIAFSKHNEEILLINVRGKLCWYRTYCISKIITDRVFYLFSETFNRNHHFFLTLTNLPLLPKPRLEPGLKLWSLVSESCTSYARHPPQPPLCESGAAHNAQLFIWNQNTNLYD